MRGISRAALVAGMSATTMLLASCGGGGGNGSGGGGATGDAAQPGKAGGEIVVRGCQPQNPLVGGDTGESCGHDIVELFTSTLFRYDANTSEPKPDLAESVESADNRPSP